MKIHFSKHELDKIRDQAMVYRCACPAQLSELLTSVRRVYDYELKCLEKKDSLEETHLAISEAVRACHAILEDCLDRVLDQEQWDRETLDMPPDLRSIGAQQTQGD